MGHGPPGPTSTQSQSEVRILSYPSRPTETASLGVGPRSLCLTVSPGDSYSLKVDPGIKSRCKWLFEGSSTRKNQEESMENRTGKRKTRQEKAFPGEVSALSWAWEGLKRELHVTVAPLCFLTRCYPPPFPRHSLLWILGETALEPRTSPLKKYARWNAGSKAPRTGGMSVHNWKGNPRGLWWATLPIIERWFKSSVSLLLAFQEWVSYAHIWVWA